MISLLASKKSAKAAEIQRMMEVYGNEIIRTAYLYLKDRHRAEDAFQEVFLKVYRKLDSFHGESSEKTWLIRITINTCKDMLRSSWLKKVEIADEVEVPVEGSDIEDILIERDEKKALYDAVLSLPEEFKDAVLLFYYHNLTTAEIGKTLTIAEGTVRSRLHRAREMLKNKLKGGVL